MSKSILYDYVFQVYFNLDFFSRMTYKDLQCSKEVKNPKKGFLEWWKTLIIYNLLATCNQNISVTFHIFWSKNQN